MSRLSKDKQIQVVAALVEGNSIRSTERTTGVRRDTVTSLLLRVAKTSERILDVQIRHVRCRENQLGEIWGFVSNKQAQTLKTTPDVASGGSECIWPLSELFEAGEICGR